MSMARAGLTQFRAVYSSGAFIPDASAVVALSLLFEKVHLPNNIELVRSFVSKYRVTTAGNLGASIKVKSEDGNDPFQDLPAAQQESARNYLSLSMQFAHRYAQLFGDVFESEFFPSGKVVNVELVKQGAPGEKNTYRVTLANEGFLSGGDDEYFPKLLDRGYVPVVGHFHPAGAVPQRTDAMTAKQLAALLAMKSVQMMLPRTRAARPDVILEARERLREQLPPFWSAMLKASVELKKLISETQTHGEVHREATDLVDRTIRPAVIDLATKLERERKDWFYRILSPVRSGLRLLVGSPPITQQQLMTSALVLASDTCTSIAENMHAIEALKREAGLCYLLELSEILEKK
jgi:hypothetical protein